MKTSANKSVCLALPNHRQACLGQNGHIIIKMSPFQMYTDIQQELFYRSTAYVLKRVIVCLYNQTFFYCKKSITLHKAVGHKCQSGNSVLMQNGYPMISPIINYKILSTFWLLTSAVKGVYPYFLQFTPLLSLSSIGQC